MLFVIVVIVAVVLIGAFAIPILAPVWPSIWASAKDAAKYYRDEINKSLRSEKRDG